MRGAAVLVLVGAFAASASTAFSEALQPEQMPVTISAFLFDPPTMTITAGESVSWVNTDGVPHTSTASLEHMWGGLMYTGQTFSVTFDAPGTFAYYCEIHPAMIGQVTVAAAE